MLNIDFLHGSIGPRPGTPLAYLAALGCTGLAGLLLLTGVHPAVLLVAFCCAVFLATWFGGRGPALVAMAFSAAAIGYVFVAGTRLVVAAAVVGGFLGLCVLFLLANEARRLALRSAAELRCLAEQSSIAIAIHNGSELRYVNSAFLQQTGCARSEITGRRFCDFIHPDFRQRIQEQIESVLAGEAPAKISEVKLCVNSGEERWLAVSTARVWLEGRRWALSGALDITARKREEENLRGQAQLVEATLHPVVARDAEDRIIFWNQGAERFYGWTREEAMGQCSRTLLKTSFPEDLEDIQSELLRSGRWSGELTHITRDGRSVFVTSFWTNQERPGAPAVIVESDFDMTARKHREERRRTAEKLSAAARMAATVAHEINNPLEAVTNCLYLAHQEQEQARKLLTTAEQQLARVAHITQQTLAFHRAGAPPAPVDVCRVAEEALEMATTLTGRRVDARTEFQCTAEMIGYPDELRQALMNVITNALESGARRVRVRVARGCNPANPHQRGLRISVADDGCGIDPEHRQQVFQPFFTTKKSKGGGLGLWVARGIVQKLEGSIRLRTSTGTGRSGTCVSIFFPGAFVAPRPNRAAAGVDHAA